MGMFNGRSDLVNNAYLKDDTCPVCTAKGITQSFENMSRASFDYVCPQCNPKVIIGISDQVLGSALLDELSKSPKRFEVRDDIRNWKKDFYPLYTKTLNFFLGYAYEQDPPDNTYERWMKGELAGPPRMYSRISQIELQKINAEQERIFEEKTQGRLEQLVSQFNARLNKSMDKDQLREKEIESLTYFLKTDNLPHKGIENEVMDLGTIQLPLYIIRGIRSQYKNAVNGELDINNVLSPNQIINVGSASSLERCMVDAVAYMKYLDFLQGETNGPDDEEQFTASELKDLHEKIDSILTEISQMKFELQTGQEILFNEIDDLKSLPALKKKNWIEVVRGKLFTLAINKVITMEVFHKIYKELTGSDIKLLGE